MTKMTRWVAAFATLCAAVFLQTVIPASADVAVPALTGRVVDLTHTLTAGEQDAIVTQLKDLETRKGSQVAVLMLPTIKPETIEQFSIRVAEAWKIGRKKVDDGLLLVIAKDDHKVRIEVGYGLEGVIPDAVAKRVIDEMITPRFKEGKFGQGISDGIDQLIKLIDGEPLPPAKSYGATGGAASDQGSAILVGLVIVGIASLVLGLILNEVVGHLLGSVSTGAVVGLVAGMLVDPVIAIGAASFAFVIALFSGVIMSALANGGSSGSSDWGGSSWSSGGSSGGGSGGFSGDGGSFGGGGASGDW